jgi:type I restriction enzyme S subunit
MKNPTHANPAMTATLLFEHFSTLATAPDGISRLRELILQMAVQGKLGTQDAGDEPASVLAKKIKKEKERLVNAGKIRNEKSLDPITEAAIPYQIPNNWTWMRFGEIGQIVGGGTPRTSNSEYYVTHGIPWLTPADLYRHKNKYIGRGRKDISEDGLKESSAQLLPEGAILFSSRAPIGYVAIASNPLSTNQGFKSCIPYVIGMSEFIYYFLVSSAKEIDAKASGTTFKEVSGQDVKHILFPLPPLSEQHRIVAKVDRLMALCDELEARQQNERAGCLRLGTASLAGLQNAESPEEFEAQWAQVCDAFDLILDCPENVAVLRQTILQMAVQGRMETHDPKDEPAEKLLEIIKKEKVQLVKDGKSKKEKPHEPVHADEVPFILPNRWMWCRFGDVATIETNIVPPDDFQNLPHVAPDNIEKGTGRLLHYRTVAEDDVQSPNHHFYPNQIVYSKIRPNLSKLTIVDFEGLCSADMYPIYSHIFNKYLKIYMLSLPFYHQAVSDENRLAMPKINQTQLNLIYVAVPPLAEQHRIVAKVDALMALCDALEARLKERAGIQTKFTDAVVKNIGTG